MSREELINQLFFALENLRRQLTPSVKHIPSNLPSPAELRMLLFISTHAETGGMTVKQIAQHLGVSSSATTQFIDALEAARLVKRKEDKLDRRKMIITPTSKALRRIQKIRTQMLSKLNASTSQLSDAEIEQLLNLLNKIS